MSLKPYSVYEKEICGHSYRIMVFKGREGLHLLAKLGYYVSNALKMISLDFKNFSIQGLLNDSDLIDKIVDTLQDALADKEKIDDVVNFICTLVKNCERDGRNLGEKDIFDIVFAENYDEIFILLKEVIIINFLSQSFMKGLLKKQIVTQMEKDKKPLPKSG